MIMYKIMDGNEACSFSSYNFTEVAGIYPITPSSPMAELIDKWSSEGKTNFFNDQVKVIEMQSEAGVAGMIHGSLLMGCLTSTYTASQGLLLMIPNMYKIAGEQLPFVINIASRSLATHALSIMGDHQDIYACRGTGFAILANSNVQDVMDLTNVAYLSTIKGTVPFLNFFDGFRTSHELSKIEVIDPAKVKELLDDDAILEFRSRALNIDNPFVKGTAQSDDTYFPIMETKNSSYEKLPDIVANYMKKINKITGKDYQPFNYYGSLSAKKIIIAMGSVCETIKEVVDYLNDNNEEVGLIEIHLYRPFSHRHLLEVLPETVKDIAVLDRTKEHGSGGEPLYLDIVNFVKSNNLNISVIGGRYGLSSRNTTPSDIKSIYDNLSKRDKINNFTVGIIDDVSNLSLPKSDFSLPKKGYEILIYGFGSDGMISASKDIIKIVGNGTKAYVQGYFEYDSRKSGGLTKSHLRFRNEPIRSTYYIEKPDLVVCTKDSYLLKYDLLSTVAENGVFILNTTRNKQELIQFLPNKIKNLIVDRKIKFYTINAYDVSKDVGLDNKISSIMETVIFRMTKLIDKEYAIREIKKSLTKRFENKGNNVLEKNFEAISRTSKELNLIELEPVNYLDDREKDKTLFEIIDNKEGYNLKVSDFKKMSDGVFASGTTRYEQRNISEVAPHFIKENCIMCNQCSFVCPHAVIRPFLLNKEETKKASLNIQESLLDSHIEDLKYTIGVNLPNCTGCGLCVNICPGKKGAKALIMKDVKDEKDNNYQFLFEEVTEKNMLPKDTVKGSQFIKPKFEFSGACAGCGETPYLKLLTQLFGKKLVIANATGCSSIYGASVPSIPYSVPWANSLFEDNAEFGYGMVIADNVMKNRIKNILKRKLSKVGENKARLYNDYLKEINDETSEKLYEYIKEGKEEELIPLLDYIKAKSFWIVGGDGWAYDIGFSGLDHILSKHENVNILVLDTEVYSNTGGQVSKSSPAGTVAKFAFSGKTTSKKDLAKMALTYPHVYVGTISLGASFNQTIQALTEAESYNGPSLIIAYSPCIEQSILKGMSNSIEEEKLATESGYFPIFRYHPVTKKFSLDSEADFCKYLDFLNGEDRYRSLKEINPEGYKKLLEQNRSEAIERYNYYSELSKKENK